MRTLLFWILVAGSALTFGCSENTQDVKGQADEDTMPPGAVGGTPLPPTGGEAPPAPDAPMTTAPLSTFSIDVDTASYSMMRRSVRGGALPKPEVVRIEEYLNYFAYDYPPPAGDQPFSITTEV